MALHRNVEGRASQGVRQGASGQEVVEMGWQPEREEPRDIWDPLCMESQRKEEIQLPGIP